jgi:hypothetical protein
MSDSCLAHFAPNGRIGQIGTIGGIKEATAVMRKQGTVIRWEEAKGFVGIGSPTTAPPWLPLRE